MLAALGCGVLAAAGPGDARAAPDDAIPSIVRIDGTSWRLAPAGTPRSGGRPGSRIILDDEVWLRADDPRFAETDAAGATDGDARRAAPRRAAASAETGHDEAGRDGIAARGTAVRPIDRTPAAALPPRDATAYSADGRRWEEAPEEPLRAAAAEERRREEAPEEPRWAEAPEEPMRESPEAFRARQRALTAERRRLEAGERSEREAALAAAAEEAGEPDAVEASEPAVLAAALPDGAGASDASGDAGPALSRADVPPPTSAPAAPSPVEESAGAVAATEPGEPGESGATAAPLPALRLPAGVRGSSDEFGYVEAMPKSYEIGGAGLGLEASGESARRFHYLVRAGIADSYRELALGAGVHVTPPDADRVTFALTAGVEYGAFELVGTDAEGRVTQTLDDDEAGAFLELSSRLVVNPRFELAGGVGYSSFHGGDPHGFGGAFFHVNRRFDLMSRFEVGDNDQLGIGLRYFY